MDNFTGCAPLDILPSNPASIQRVPAVMDLNFLPDMGRMTARLLGDAMPFRYQRETCGHRVTASYRYPLTIPFYESPELDLSASACFPAGGSTG
jgi:hypothetical protein